MKNCAPWLPMLMLITCACMFVGSAQATTTNLRGIIVAVKEEKAEHQGKPYTRHRMTMLNTWGFTRYSGEDEVDVSLVIYNDAHVFLDGRKSTVKEAMKPGYLVKALVDINYYHCYSKDYRFNEAVPDSFGPDRGVYRLRLPDAASQQYLKGNDRKGSPPPAPRHAKLDLFLHLLCQNGKVVAAAASQNARKDMVNVPSMPVDTSGLRIEGGRLRGIAVVTFFASGKWLFNEKDQGQRKRRFELDAPLGQQSATGKFKTIGSDATKEMEVRGSPEPLLGKDRTVWIRLRAPLGNLTVMGPWDYQHYAFSIRFTDGQLTSGLFCSFGKGYPDGRVTDSDLAWDNHRVKGTVEVAGKGRFKGTIELDGIVIGDRLFGSCSTITTKGHRRVGKIRGGILELDAPPVVGWDEGQAKKLIPQILKGQPLPDVIEK